MNPMKILVVDDSKSARYALRLQLQRHGVLVETADSAEAGLERVKEDPPDAVFMDHTMPGMNGFEALDVLKSGPETARIPIVMCTSTEDAGFLAQAQRKGAFDILSKNTAPDKIPEILDRLRQTIAATAAGPGPQPLAATVAAAAIPADLQDIARREAQRLIQERIEELVRAQLAPLIEEVAERLQQQLIVAQGEQIQTTVNRIVRDLIPTVVNERLDGEGQRLQQKFLLAQSEQVQTADRIIRDLMPAVVREQWEKERRNLAHMVQDLIDTTVDGLADQPAFLRRILEATEATVAHSAERAVQRQAQEIAKSLASERSSRVADSLAESARASIRRMNLLAAGAAGCGIAAALVVYLLVRG